MATMTTSTDVVWGRSPQEAADAANVVIGAGLGTDEAATRLACFGPNELPPARGRGPVLRFVLQFHSPLIYVLLVSALAAGLVGEHADAVVIVAVLLVNAIIGFAQESRAEGALAALAAMTETTTTVIRDGVRMPVPSREVVPGDLVVLEPGDRVPADLRLVETHELRVDESALTGEAVPAGKDTAALPANTLLADRANMAYSGTLVTNGSGVGIAATTGAGTEIGLIHGLMRRTTARQTPLTRKLARFSRVVTVAVLILAAATFAVGVARGKTPGEMLVAAIALAVGAIPEGLPAMVTIALAFGVARMVRRKVVVRRLPVVETLGSTTVICTDKTGTLTENKMTVVSIAAGGRTHDVSPEAARNAAAHECLLAGLACNDSRLVGEDEISGDPTEAALLVSAARTGQTEPPPRLDSLPFSSERGYMATLHPGVIYVKGSVERVLQRCEAQLDAEGRSTVLDRPGALETAERLGHEGLRVLAFASAVVPAETTTLTEDGLPPLVFLGLQGMYDPPRKASVTAVRACQDAGIQVKMITGDHAATAQAIAARTGLAGPVMTGADLDHCPDGLLPQAAERTAVFARVSPEQKLRLVRALQRRGHVIAMTGDGVNDAPALKRADIGVAMGRGGTDVAKESADMVLTDDDFASIEAAVEEGRGVFDNLTRFIVWALPANVGLGLVLIAAIAAGTRLPLLPIQVLWINMTAVLILGLPFTLEPPDPDLMRRPPRDPSRPLLTGVLAGRVLLVSAILLAGAFGLFHWDLSHGATVAEARTVVVNVFAMTLTTYLFNCLSLVRPVLWSGVHRNPSIIAAVLTLAAVQILYTYLPLTRGLLDSAPLDAAAWLRVSIVAVVSYLLIEASKALHGTKVRRNEDAGP